MKPQTVVVTIRGGLTESGKGAALGYLLNELQADGIDATLFEVHAPHNVVCAAPKLLRELVETAKDLREWDGSTDALEIMERNLAAAITKATGKRTP